MPTSPEPDMPDGVGELPLRLAIAAGELGAITTRWSLSADRVSSARIWSCNRMLFVPEFWMAVSMASALSSGGVTTPFSPVGPVSPQNAAALFAVDTTILNADLPKDWLRE